MKILALVLFITAVVVCNDSNGRYYSSSYYTAKPEFMPSDTSDSEVIEEAISAENYVYKNLPFVVGIFAEEDDKKSSIFLGNLTSSAQPLFSEFITSQMNVKYTPLAFSSDCYVYVGINSGWNVYDWESLALIKQVQINQTGLKYTPTTRGLIFDNDNNVILIDPYGRIVKYSASGDFLAVVGDLNFHGDVSSAVLDNNILYIGAFSNISSYSYPELELQHVYQLPLTGDYSLPINPTKKVLDDDEDENSSSNLVYSIVFITGSDLFFALQENTIYQLNKTDPTFQVVALNATHNQQFLNAQYYQSEDEPYSQFNGLLLTDSLHIGNITSFQFNESTYLPINDSAKLVYNTNQKKNYLYKFLIIPESCSNNAEATPLSYPNITGDYIQKVCEENDFNVTVPGNDGIVLSCADLGDSFSVVEQSGSAITIQVSIPSSKSSENVLSNTTTTISGSFTAFGYVSFVIPLNNASSSVC